MDNKKRILYAETNYDQEEINSVINVLENQPHSLVGGSNTKEFEENISKIFLEENNVQTRPIFSGNITKQPMMKGRKFKTNDNGYENSDFIMKNGMLIGCHPKLTFSDLDYICTLLKQFFYE